MKIKEKEKELKEKHIEIIKMLEKEKEINALKELFKQNLKK